MTSIIYNDIDAVSSNAHKFITNSKANHSEFNIVKQESDLTKAELPDNVSEPAIFLSKHVSGMGIPSLTVHSEGNWSDKAELGGMPHKLSMASPVEMLGVLIQMSNANVPSINVTYEATHHGPFTRKRSFFAEVGGNADIISNPDLAGMLAEMVMTSLAKETNFNKVVVGIGGNHYSKRFTKIAIDKGYAFAHIMPRYYINETQMLSQAFEMSYPRPELAVIEWKSMNATERNEIIKELNVIGIDYERI